MGDAETGSSEGAAGALRRWFYSTEYETLVAPLVARRSAIQGSTGVGGEARIFVAHALPITQTPRSMGLPGRTAAPERPPVNHPNGGIYGIHGVSGNNGVIVCVACLFQC